MVRFCSLTRRLLAALLTLLFLTAFLVFPGAAADDEPNISSQAAVIFNASDGGEILYEKNAKQAVYCGFLPRIMTCLLLLESGRDLSEKVTITNEILTNTPNRSSAGLSLNDIITLADLIKCVTVANSQEAAVAIALTLEGRLADFVARMNTRAKQLGASDTVFTNVTGSYTTNTKQITTLADCAILLTEALLHNEILEPAEQRLLSVEVNGKNKTLYTRNMLIDSQSVYYNRVAKGLFIYFEEESVGAIASYRQDSSRKIISMAVTTAGLKSLYKDAGTLLTYSQNRYTTRTILERGKTVKEIPVRYGNGSDFVVLTTADSITAYMAKRYTEQDISYVFSVPEQLEAPIARGQVLGTVTVVCGGREYGTVDLVAQTEISLDNFALYSEKLMRIFTNRYLWLTLGILTLLIGGYILLAYRINRPARKKKTPKSHTGGRIRMSKFDADEE